MRQVFSDARLSRAAIVPRRDDFDRRARQAIRNTPDDLPIGVARKEFCSSSSCGRWPILFSLLDVMRIRAEPGRAIGAGQRRVCVTRSPSRRRAGAPKSANTRPNAQTRDLADDQGANLRLITEPRVGKVASLRSRPTMNHARCAEAHPTGFRDRLLCGSVALCRSSEPTSVCHETRRGKRAGRFISGVISDTISGWPNLIFLPCSPDEPASPSAFAT